MLATVTGMKGSKGTYEGVSYDSTTVFVQVKLDDSKGTAKGHATGEYKFGDASTFDKYKHLPFPFQAEIELETVTSGRVMKTVITALKPLQPAPAPAAAKA